MCARLNAPQRSYLGVLTAGFSWIELVFGKLNPADYGMFISVPQSTELVFAKLDLADYGMFISVPQSTPFAMLNWAGNR